MAVSDPVLSQQMECTCGQWDIPILNALAPMDVNHSSIRVDVPHMQVASFIESDSQRVDRPKEDFHTVGGTGINDPMGLLDGDDFGQ